MAFLIRRLLWLPVWHGVYFFLKRPRRLLYLGAAIFAAIWFGLADSVYDSDVPPLAVTQQVPANAIQSVAQLPAISGKIDDGNSVFAKRLESHMQEPDLAQYSNYFYYAVENAPVNQRFQWMYSNQLFGHITPQASFRNSRGLTCRHFTELLSYHGKNQSYSGVACQRSRGGWCKLKSNSAYTCDLGNPSSIRVWFKNLF